MLADEVAVGGVAVDVPDVLRAAVIEIDERAGGAVRTAPVVASARARHVRERHGRAESGVSRAAGTAGTRASP